MTILSAGPFHRKIQLRDDLLLEVYIRTVRASRNYPEGIRYRCYLGNPKTREVVVLYDIHPGKPHHKHTRGRQDPYLFTTPEQLWDDFVVDVEAVLRGEL